MSAPDVESQESIVPKTMEENTTMINDDDNAGKGMGIAIFVLIIVGTVSAFLLPYLYISLPCYFAALVLAYVLTCGCCCAKNYNLKPHVKKMATATLVTLVLLFIVSTILSVGSVMVLQSVISLHHGYDETTGTFSDTTWYINGTMILILSIIGYVLFLLLICLALIFSGIFTWGRKCGAPGV